MQDAILFRVTTAIFRVFITLKFFQNLLLLNSADTIDKLLFRETNNVLEVLKYAIIMERQSLFIEI